jgi:hypothetical protein
MAGAAGLRVAEVDVEMRPRQGGVPSAPGTKGFYHLARLLLAIGLQGTAKRPATSAGTGAGVAVG